MLEKNRKDMIAGVLIAAMGVMISLHSYLNLEMGVARRMGPGMVPFWLGVVLLVCGVLIFREGRRTADVPVYFPIRAPFFVLLSVAAFALLVRHVGIIPAVFALVAVSTLAEGKLNPLRMLLLAVGLAVLCYVLFDLMLRLSLPMFDWRF